MGCSKRCFLCANQYVANVGTTTKRFFFSPPPMSGVKSNKTKVSRNAISEETENSESEVRRKPRSSSPTLRLQSLQLVRTEGGGEAVVVDGVLKKIGGKGGKRENVCLDVVFAFFLPFLWVVCHEGCCSLNTLFVWLLCLLGYLPGCIFAVVLACTSTKPHRGCCCCSVKEE